VVRGSCQAVRGQSVAVRGPKLQDRSDGDDGAAMVSSRSVRLGDPALSCPGAREVASDVATRNDRKGQ
jgi:hypothetical protein